MSHELPWAANWIKVACFGMCLSEWIMSLMSDSVSFFFFFTPLDHFRLLVLCCGKHHNYPVCDEGWGRICPTISTFLSDCPQVQRLSSSVCTWNIHCFLQPLSCAVSLCVWLCVCALLGPFVSAFVLQRLVCVVQQCEGSVALGWGLVFDNSPWTGRVK